MSVATAVCFFAEGRENAGYAMRPQIATGLRDIPKGAILPKTPVVGVFAFNVSEVCHRAFHSTEPEIKTCRLKAHRVLSWGASRLRFGAPAGIIVWLPSKGGYANCRFPIISAFRIIVKCLQYPQKTMHSFFWGWESFR